MLKIASLDRFIDATHGAAVNAGAVALANALTENTSLRKLSVSDNYIGALGAGPLATALTRNSSITSLYMKGCELGDTVSARLCACLLVR
jgi:Ran GTPase-activating protein (RanGAP) involved in mRNA processing and transport